MKKVNIWLDMDGTIADLYNHTDWLKRLRNNDSTVFQELNFMDWTEELFETLSSLQVDYKNELDITIGIITWASMEAPYKMQLETAFSKSRWLNSIIREFNTVHYDGINIDLDKNFFVLPYGTPKQSVVYHRKNEYHILIDDNIEVLQTWSTKTKRVSIMANEKSAVVLESFLAHLVE